MLKNLFIETIGCQMNERDSEIMLQLLEQQGYLLCADLDSADAVIVNTCSIRGKAEQKAYSFIGSLRRLKKKKPHLIIAVAGCVAQQEGAKMKARMPHVDIIVGPQAIYQLPDFFRQAADATAVIATSQHKDFTIPPFLPDIGHGLPHKRFVTIMQGCNNYCTYCIVPYTRGREVSRRPEDILAEVRHLVDGGVREITLLGQNVNSYGNDHPAGGQTSFPELLRQVAAVPGLVRLRFTTSNPKDLSPALMACFQDLDNLCHHFHLPVQSGSNAVLKKMNRKYTVESYMDKVRGLRRACADISLTTDIIVGFPGETEADFLATMDLLEEVRYDSAFSFKYSSRPPAASCNLAETVSEEEKAQRLALFQKRQNEISLERHQEYVGTTLPVMIEGESKTGQGQWSGRSSHNLIVNFHSPRTYRPGELENVTITEGCLHSLRAELSQGDK
ncbi:MAG: tRNA (N6-isopentenyl adenosine(37)-C2)-methylthiotransferase MiaB [Desulfobulbaceae bacterium]|nr:MAG: tRNA (N6-isopentenyl adenosine(37)-C2)-methylthiotransferase MiaB [Desulfobulbaceae bacterium]